MPGESVDSQQREDSTATGVTLCAGKNVQHFVAIRVGTMRGRILASFDSRSCFLFVRRKICSSEIFQRKVSYDAQSTCTRSNLTAPGPGRMLASAARGLCSATAASTGLHTNRDAGLPRRHRSRAARFHRGARAECGTASAFPQSTGAAAGVGRLPAWLPRWLSCGVSERSASGAGLLMQQRWAAARAAAHFAAGVSLRA